MILRLNNNEWINLETVQHFELQDEKEGRNPHGRRYVLRINDRTYTVHDPIKVSIVASWLHERTEELRGRSYGDSCGQ